MNREDLERILELLSEIYKTCPSPHINVSRDEDEWGRQEEALVNYKEFDVEPRTKEIRDICLKYLNPESLERDEAEEMFPGIRASLDKLTIIKEDK